MDFSREIAGTYVVFAIAFNRSVASPSCLLAVVDPLHLVSMGDQCVFGGLLKVALGEQLGRSAVILGCMVVMLSGPAVVLVRFMVRHLIHLKRVNRVLAPGPIDCRNYRGITRGGRFGKYSVGA